MSNRGNTGHRGYKMSKVTNITFDNTQVLITLACGHIQKIYPFSGYTPEQYVKHIQQGIRPFVVGETRIRCKEQH